MIDWSLNACDSVVVGQSIEYTPLYEAWAGAAAAFFAGAAVAAFLGGIVTTGYGLVAESMNFQTSCWMSVLNAVDL